MLTSGFVELNDCTFLPGGSCSLDVAVIAIGAAAILPITWKLLGWGF